MTDYLSVEQILVLHEEQLERFGGRAGCRDLGALEAAVARPAMTFGGDDLYLDIPTKVAALFHSLVMNHPFVDGNKRVAAHAAIVFLLANGCAPTFSPEELVDVTLAAARGERTPEQLAIWFRQRMARLEP